MINYKIHKPNIRTITTDLVHIIRTNLSILQNQPLSGGIVAKNLHISDNGSGELSLYGDFTIN